MFYCNILRWVSHLNTSIVRSHLILNPVFFEDVYRLQECHSFYVLSWFRPVWEGKELKKKSIYHWSKFYCKLDSHFANIDAQLFGCERGKELIAVEDGFVVALYQNHDFLEERVWFLCDRDLGWKYI